MLRICRILPLFWLWLTIVPFSAAASGQDSGRTAPLEKVPGSLKWRAALAKERGQTATDVVTLSGSEPQISVSSLIAHSLVIDGTIISSVVDISDNFDIYTWYRVKVIQHGDAPKWRAGDDSAQPPAQLVVDEHMTDEVVVRMRGGVAVVDGVTMTEHAEPVMVVGKRYLLFLEPLGEKTFRSAYQSKPLPVDKNGDILPNPDNKFTARFSEFRSIDNLLNSAK